MIRPTPSEVIERAARQRHPDCDVLVAIGDLGIDVVAGTRGRNRAGYMCYRRMTVPLSNEAAVDQVIDLAVAEAKAMLDGWDVPA